MFFFRVLLVLFGFILPSVHSGFAYAANDIHIKQGVQTELSNHTEQDFDVKADIPVEKTAHVEGDSRKKGSAYLSIDISLGGFADLTVTNPSHTPDARSYNFTNSPIYFSIGYQFNNSSFVGMYYRKEEFEIGSIRNLFIGYLVRYTHAIW